MTTVHLIVLAGFVAVLALALTSRSRPRRGAPPVAVPNLRILRSAWAQLNEISLLVGKSPQAARQLGIDPD
jgi:hypothetical protein